MAYAERNLPLSAALVACLGLFGLQPQASAEEISIPGVEEGSDILRALAIAFGGHGEGKLVLVPPTIGAGGAVSDVISNRTIFARINRTLLDHERQAGLVAVPIFELPIVLIGHPAIQRINLTSAELEGIRKGRWRNWRELGGPDLAIALVVHREFEGTLGDAPGRMRRAQLARAREVEDLVRQVPGSIGLTTGVIFAGEGTSLLSLDGHQPGAPGYPLRAQMMLAFKPDQLSPLARDFLAFMRSERAGRLMAGHGARPVLQ